MEPPATSPTHRKHSTWTSKFGTKQRLQLASLTRLAGISRPARSRCALFQDLKTSGRFSERFAADKPFDQILRDVAAHFGYAEIAQFYIADQHGDLRPVSSADELAKAFASWESSSGPRMRAKLASVVDETLEKLRSPDAERQLLGALAAWELACEPASHERMDGNFFGALVEKLHSPHFAVATHAAAAVHYLRQTAATAARFPTAQLPAALAAALRLTAAPPDDKELPDAVGHKASAAQLCRASCAAGWRW